ncbi:GNAT family N-acetyltransferase [Lentibacillus sp. N15]|uniref:GNAT family N-acetyltransferase n=1 Tax=Lentibacillus songyuanensis TaxID=3136161 RepID=UPI0031BA95C6
MKTIIHKQIDTLDKILPKWETLKEEYREITVFQDIGWLKSCWEYNKKERNVSPYIVEVKHDNKAVAIIPLYISYKELAGLNFRVLKPIGSDFSDYSIPILSKKYSPEILLRAALKEIYRDKKSWDYIDWGDLPEDTVFDSFLNSNLPDGYELAERKRSDMCPFLVLNNDLEKVKGRINEKLLKEIQYLERRLKKEGEIKYYKVKNENEIEPIMNKFFDLHCERWKNTNTPSEFQDVRERDYVMEAAKNLFKSNLLYLALLSHNDEIMVVHYGMSDGKRNYLYLHAMNMKYKKYSPGKLFVYHLILDSCREGYDIVDFLKGDEGYKHKWGTSDKYNVRYVLSNHSIRSILFKKIYRTYYSKMFIQRTKIEQILSKLVIRSTVLLLMLTKKLKANKGAL